MSFTDGKRLVLNMTEVNVKYKPLKSMTQSPKTFKVSDNSNGAVVSSGRREMTAPSTLVIEGPYPTGSPGRFTGAGHNPKSAS